ncbi:hypothetical protein BWI96_13560 [Siphonobacter sp. SORGH_AS_0500]|uniref:hypothetical protein n=1 Tax=Siphonobacter sp. SORGH_AS_0500 TaxID=1864824 RepID=UPI000CB46DF9|nr:hypothetical protein [Siphonobacter sp. SORGH_AS_0500]PKK36044.1 hypothetical protein BWI96_13560 [Siphonobacter sp. SORGH_AS_0500]
MEERNQRPKEGSSLPTITLGVLAIIVAALLYIGYAYFMDEDAVTLTPQKVEKSAVTENTADNMDSDVPTPTAVEPEAIDATPSAATTSTSSEEAASESKQTAKTAEVKKRKLPKRK